MNHLHIDIETYSSVPIKCGVYKYVESPDFEILLFAYSVDDERVKVIDLKQGEEIPGQIMYALTAPGYIKHAYNANFERVAIEKHFKTKLKISQWHCTLVKAGMMGLPMNLDGVAKALSIPEQKDKEGKNLLRYFTMPCKPTKANGQRTRNLPADDIGKWIAFKKYATQDVSVEKAIAREISHFQIPKHEIDLYMLDQRINDRGVVVDQDLVNKAIQLGNEQHAKAIEEAIELTGVANPKSIQQLKGWLSKQLDQDITDLTKEAIPKLKELTDDKIIHRVLEIRQETGKTSVKKYDSIRGAISDDGRLRGMFQFIGANRTWRWAGRRVQVHNLPRNKVKDLEYARKLIKGAGLDVAELMYNVPFILSELIRTAFIAREGHKLAIVDLSSIEARVIAWLAGEKWRLDVFKTHGMIYEASAAQMFKVPIESITGDSDLRQRGKVSELALGFGGGVGALERMGAVKLGIAEDELPELVKMWRWASPKICKLWKIIECAAIATVAGQGTQTVPIPGTTARIVFSMFRRDLSIMLPSGRPLIYHIPFLIDGQYGPILNYYGVDQTTKKWWKIDTYGGKLVENIVQAIARDVLADGMLRIDKAGYNIVLHVHDETVSEVKDEPGHVEKITQIMKTPIPWAPGLPLDAKGFESKFYKK
jgi:DNA polymerase